MRSACAGYAATLLMERVSNWVYGRQPQATREREEALRSEMPTTTLARKLAGALGAELDDTRASQIGNVLHVVFGAGGGPATDALIRCGVPPMAAGMATGLGMFVFVDEGFNTVAGLTPPPGAWPVGTHVRAFVNHVAYGAALGVLLEGPRR